MVLKRIDARGLSCPQPVVLTDRAIASGVQDLEVVVDNEVACENVSRLARRRGLEVKVRHEGKDMVVTLGKT